MGSWADFCTKSFLGKKCSTSSFRRGTKVCCGQFKISCRTELNIKYKDGNSGLKLMFKRDVNGTVIAVRERANDDFIDFSILAEIFIRFEIMFR